MTELTGSSPEQTPVLLYLATHFEIFRANNIAKSFLRDGDSTSRGYKLIIGIYTTVDPDTEGPDAEHGRYFAVLVNTRDLRKMRIEVKRGESISLSQRDDVEVLTDRDYPLIPEGILKYPTYARNRTMEEAIAACCTMSEEKIIKDAWERAHLEKATREGPNFFRRLIN